MSLSRTEVRAFVAAEMERRMPAEYSPRVWRAVRRDAADKAADRFQVTRERILQMLRGQR